MQTNEPTNARNVDQHDEIDILEIGRIFWLCKRAILGASLATAVLALGLSFIWPKTYTAQATLLPMVGNEGAASMAGGLATQMGAAGGMLGALGSLGAGRSGDLVEVLSSRSMVERVIAKCGLEKELKWETREELTKRVTLMTKISPPTLKNKIVAIHVSAPSATLSATIANTYASELQEMLDEIGYNRAASNRKFIERQLAKTRGDLSQAEDKLVKFQAGSQLTSLPETVAASIKSLSDLESKRIDTEAQLRTANEALDDVRARVNSLQVDPRALIDLDMKRKSLAAQQAALAKEKSNFQKNLTTLPPQGMALARLQREVQVLNAIYLSLSQQYETAIISENKDSDAFVILDNAVVPEKPSKPKKGLNTLLGLIFGFLAGSTYVLIWHFSHLGRLTRKEAKVAHDQR